jgi:predicted HTH domain antitoxin
MILAIELYIGGKVSMGRAAELTDVSYDEFFRFLMEKSQRIRIGPRTLEEAEREYNETQERLAS